MYSAARVNQFKMKDTCIVFFLINVSRQGNNVKIIWNFNKISMGNKWQHTSIFKTLVVLSASYSQPCETNNAKCFPKIVIG